MLIDITTNNPNSDCNQSLILQERKSHFLHKAAASVEETHCDCSPSLAPDSSAVRERLQGSSGLHGEAGQNKKKTV